MNKITKVLVTSFITNISLSLTKIIFGIIGKSGALIADGIHSISDTVTDIVAIFGQKLSLKPADEKHPFGHGRMEYLTCAIIGLIIALLGCSVISNGLSNNHQIPSIYTAIITTIVILAKLVLSKYLLKKGQKYQSNILTASGKESFSDVISSIVVLFSILIAQLSDKYSILIYTDTIATTIIGILILKIAYNILKENLSNLLGEQVIDENYLQNIKKIIKKEPEVKNIDTLFILKYGPYYHVNLEVSMREDIILKDAHNILEQIENNLKNFDNKITTTIIHINPFPN